MIVTFAFGFRESARLGDPREERRRRGGLLGGGTVRLHGLAPAARDRDRNRDDRDGDQDDAAEHPQPAVAASFFSPGLLFRQPPLACLFLLLVREATDYLLDDVGRGLISAPRHGNDSDAELGVSVRMKFLGGRLPLLACKYLVTQLEQRGLAGACFRVPAMSPDGSGAPAGGLTAPQRSQNRFRLAVIDRDPGFMQVLSNRLDSLGWDHRALSSPVTPDALVAMRLNALVLDLAVLGPASWEYLERVCARLPGLAVIVCTGPSSVAQRVRGLRLGRMPG